MSSLTHGSGPSLLPGSIPSRLSHQRAPLQRKMPVFSGGIGILARQNMRYPKSFKVVALTHFPSCLPWWSCLELQIFLRYNLLKLWPQGMSESDSQNNRGSASDLFAAFSLFRTACLPPRRITAAPLESISSFLSFSLEVNLALVKGVVVAVPEAGACSQHSSGGQHSQAHTEQPHRTCPVRRQPCLGAGRNRGGLFSFLFLQTWTIAEART